MYVYVYVEELFALAEKQQQQQNGRLALPCALRSHDYHHVTGSANQKRRHANKIQKKEGKMKQIE